MMLWTAPDPAPNPRRLRMFLFAKGLVLPTTELALAKGEHKAPAVLALNPRGQVPFLELDDGQILAETVAICRYLDEAYPEPPLFGSSAFERAETDMWVRRVESALGVPLSLAWQHGHPYTARLVTQIPAMADQARSRFADALGWFDVQLADRDWLAGDRATVADIVLLSTVEFAAWIELPIPAALTALADWQRRAAARFVPATPG